MVLAIIKRKQQHKTHTHTFSNVIGNDTKDYPRFHHINGFDKHANWMWRNRVRHFQYLMSTTLWISLSLQFILCGVHWVQSSEFLFLLLLFFFFVHDLIRKLNTIRFPKMFNNILNVYFPLTMQIQNGWNRASKFSMKLKCQFQSSDNIVLAIAHF